MSVIKTIQVHKCDNCGKESPWDNNWFSRTYFHTSGGPGPWDELVTVCSIECREAYDIKCNKGVKNK